jgi:hypothetical protein
MFDNDNSQETLDSSEGGTVDRRQNNEIRARFETAYTMVLPFLDPKQGLGGKSMARHAYPVLKEAFPHLTMQDLTYLVPALERVFKERSKTSP